MITGVAMKSRSTELVTTLPKPNKHSDVIHACYQLFGKQMSHGEWVQGFVDDKGQFLDRHDAAKHVLECNQELTERAFETAPYKDILFSEDVW